MRKGFALDDDRLKGNGGGTYWKELLDRIRDIRSSEKVLYRQVLDLYATSIDYDPHSDESVLFFKMVQNKLCEAKDNYHLGKLERTLAKADLLILDELSYLSFNRHQSELLFKVISDRSE